MKKQTLLKSFQIQCSQEDELKYSRLLPSMDSVCDFIQYLYTIVRRQGVALSKECKKNVTSAVKTTLLTLLHYYRHRESEGILTGYSASVIPNMYKQMGDARKTSYHVGVSFVETQLTNFVETQLTNFADMHGNIPQSPFDPQRQGKFQFISLVHYNVVAVATYMLEILTKHRLPCHDEDIFKACLYLKILPEYRNFKSGVKYTNAILRKYHFTTLEKDKFLIDHANRVEYAFKAQGYYANILKVMFGGDKDHFIFTDQTNSCLNTTQLADNRANLLLSANYDAPVDMINRGERLCITGSLSCLNIQDPHNSTLIIPCTFEYREMATKNDEKKMRLTNKESHMHYFKTCQSPHVNANTVYIQDNAPYHVFFGSNKLAKKPDIIDALVSQGVSLQDLKGQKISEQREIYKDQIEEQRKLVLQKAVEELGGTVINMPAYQSELQPVERLWKMYKGEYYKWAKRPHMNAKTLILKSREIIGELGKEYQKLGNSVANALEKIKSEVQMLLKAEGSFASVLKAYKKDNNISSSDKYPLLIIPIPDTTKYYAWRDTENPQIVKLRKYMIKIQEKGYAEKTINEMEEEQFIEPENQDVFERPEVQAFLNSTFLPFSPHECAKYRAEAKKRFDMKKPGTIIMGGKRPRGRPPKDVGIEKQSKKEANTSASSSKKSPTSKKQSREAPKRDRKSDLLREYDSESLDDSFGSLTSDEESSDSEYSA